MIILPAIDIKDGQCVRLYQGDYDQVTTYDVDPAKISLRWQRSGASWLHIVDLDGAAAGHPVNIELIKGFTQVLLCISNWVEVCVHWWILVKC